ncbi:MAG: hypothetical protein K8S13_19765 [Desulfobacula sp.]|uniref:hypothetical protein n=1 Tax=Desulfobacula sp. TaxID=2593537 RepID=UPI0025C61E95|nr:hypothetical protein [Desulfobacula sp.]MCD4722076.1 hypothetical protein [Desulfobacula sp.]
MNFLLGLRIAGILSILSGISMYNTGWDNKWGVQISPSAALFLSLLGCIMFFLSFIVKQKINQGEMICTKCKTKYQTRHIQINICPKCNGKLVPFVEE